MLTKGGHAESLFRQSVHGFVARMWSTHRRLSWRLGDAAIGAAALGLIVSAMLAIPVGASFGAKWVSLGGALWVVMLLFPPAILGAMYSLFFEPSKIYAGLALLLAGSVLLVQPFSWYWLKLYLPFACAFVIFCVVVWALERRRKR